MSSLLRLLRYSRYSRRFRVPVKTARSIAETREGILVELEDETGNRVSTEIAPWEGFGCESLDDAETALRNLAAAPFPLEKIDEILAPGTFPCTYHALSAGFFFSKNPESLKAPEAPNERICKLVLRRDGDSTETLIEQIRRFRKESFRTFKLKIGLTPLDDEIRFCKKILMLVAENFPEIKIRFDANGAWNSALTLEKLTALNAFPQLDFIEQPLAASPENDAAIYALPSEIAAKIALDESLREPWQMPTGTSVVAVVKPLLVGDFFRLRKWLSPEENAPRFVISSVFETECGRAVLRALCSATRSNPRALAAGIGTRESFRA